METIYAASDIFVLPSLQEGMSNAIMEAMAMRKIIIVSDIPENQELITHEKTGITFPAGNASALAAALSEIEQSLDEYCFLAEAAHREADEKYSIDSIAFQYAEFLRSL